MAFMEAAAMYLRYVQCGCLNVLFFDPICRDVNKVVEASKAYRSDATKESAYRLLEESTAPIDQIVCILPIFHVFI